MGIVWSGRLMETYLLSQKMGYGDDTDREVKDEEEIAKKKKADLR